MKMKGRGKPGAAYGIVERDELRQTLNPGCNTEEHPAMFQIGNRAYDNRAYKQYPSWPLAA